MEPIVDQGELERQTFGEADLMREVIGMFARQTPELVAAMEAAAGAGRAEIAHRLKGASLSLGAKALAAAAARIEERPVEDALLAEARRLAGETIAALERLARE